jgi:nicotinamidase-related amidase
MEAYVTKENINEKTKKWLKEVELYNQHKMKLDKDKSALIIIDMQNFFLDPSLAFTCGGVAIIPNLKQLVESYRRAVLPIIFTRHVHHPDGIDAGIMGWWWEGMCLEGSPHSEVYPELSPLPNEKVIFKHRYSAFYNTDLETILRCLKIQDLVITGVMTNLCCESTARDAYFRDYRIFFLADGTGAVCEEMHQASLLNLAFGFAQITTTNDILNQL